MDRHARVGDADVLVEIVDPRGNVERKHMLHTQGGGLADYSELFDFEWSGAYRIHAVITPARGGKPVESRFVVHHVI